MCWSCKSAGGGLNKDCEFEHFSELTGAEEGSRRSWTCLWVSQSTPGQALPLPQFSFVGEIKVKHYLTLNLRWVICSFPFPYLRGIFFFLNLRKAFVPLLKFQRISGMKVGKKFVPTALKGFFPWASQRQETKYNNSFCKIEMLTVSRAQSSLHQSGGYKEQHEAYTNNHTLSHILCAYLLT